ncbi:class I adenylate-forming enzyme family protein [uncultured Enterovirga sp.]|uniref:class I adenylate-forming enzyme family protein n=1 Tax=uncultured Enterovirga sp. TaxID=2026352 RepID=UPI0035CA5799
MRPFLTLHHPAQARRFYEDGTWRADTFYTLLTDAAAARPDAAALRDGRRILTWRELLTWVDGFAADLRLRGLSAGDRLSIWASNRVEVVVSFLAASREGIACNPSLHRTYRSSEIVGLLRTLGSKAFVTEPGWGADRTTSDLDGLLADLPGLAVTYPDGTLPGEAGAPPSPHVADPDKIAYLAFTSGTTGAPKCVMHSDNSLLANARDLVRDWGHGQHTKLLTLSPLSHHIAWVAVAQWLVAGCELITDDPPPGTGRLDWILETGATYVMGVPTHAMDILAAQRERGLTRLGAVEVFYMAGAPIPPSVAEAFVRQGIRPQNVYGMTENSSHQYTHPGDETATVVSTCGRGGRAYEVKLFDPGDPDREVGAGEVGHIGGKGAALMLGYLGNQAATEGSFNREGWFLSGDLGILDEAGNLRIEGRIKDLIIRGGHNIYPAQIEALALRHPAIVKAAAFSVPDERLGERVCLAIIGAVSSDEALAHLHDEGLSKYDMPEYWLQVEAFPLTASGKILKRVLMDQVRSGELAPEPVRFQAAAKVTA